MSDATSESKPRSPRILVLPAAAIIIASLTAWRMANPRTGMNDGPPPEMRRPAPTFQLYEQGSQNTKPRVVNLDAFLHRHTIVLVFYDGQQGPDADPVLQELREFHPALKREGIVVMGVSTVLPQENRNNSSRPYPFRLLSDVTATATTSVHRVWGRFIEPPSLDKPARTNPGVFIIDRAGLVAWEGDFPKSERNPKTVVARLLSQY